MNSKSRMIVLVAILTQAAALWAQVPPMISYQGRITASGTNFTGTGQFAFALVDGGTLVPPAIQLPRSRR